MADLKIYADRKSQPSRAILIFCKVNGIEFEEVNMDIFKGEHKSPEYEAINPMKKVPAIAHGNFTLFESHAILIYLACSYKVAEHWYPTDLCTRAKLHSVLDWHHTNLRAASVGYLINTVIGPKLGLEHSPKGVAEMKQKLSASFSTIDTFWLKGDDGNVKFLLGTDQPTIADLSLVCEIMALHMVPEEDYNRLISPYKKVVQWIENVKKATNPHFDEVHQHLFEVIAS